MSPAPWKEPTALPPTVARLIDRVCDRFEAAWKTAGPGTNNRPNITAYLESAPDVPRLPLLTELLGLELAYRRQLGEQPTVAEYQQRFPEASAVLALLFADSPLPPSTSAAEPPPYSASLTLPGLELLEILGRGSTSVVYRARQLQPKRVVAVKLIPYHLKEFPEDVQTQLAAVARLRHPDIVQLHDFGIHDDLLYLILELVDGGTLAQRLAGGAEPPRLAAAFVCLLADALQYAHQQGVMHLDLKPANVLLTAAGLPKLADFGLAAFFPGDLPCGKVDSERTLPYRAPEQFTGVPTAGPPTDIHALGAILYQLLTGQVPFPRASVRETAIPLLSAEPIPPRNWQAEIPSSLEAICLRCLCRDPRERYQTAAALREDLQRFLKGESLAGPSLFPRRRLLQWLNYQLLAALALLTLLVLLYLLLTGG